MLMAIKLKKYGVHLDATDAVTTPTRSGTLPPFLKARASFYLELLLR
jgi:hypothetical protein